MRITLFLFVILSITSNGQGIDSLDVNQVRSTLNADGRLFYNPSPNRKFHILDSIPIQTIFTSGLWIMADSAGKRTLASQKFYSTFENEFRPGPVNNTGLTDSLKYYRVWKINRAEIDHHKANYNQPNYSADSSITNWPAHGDTTLGEAYHLAPFVDLDGDGNYEPSDGEHPCIRGDQALYAISTDQRDSANTINIQNAEGNLNIEVHTMLYAYNNTGIPLLDTTVFVTFRLINRSSFDYDSLTVGFWNDFDIDKSSQDDFLGVDVQRQLVFGYNADMTNTYLSTPPAQGVVLLKGMDSWFDGMDNDFDALIDEPSERAGMFRSIFYFNDFSQFGNPTEASDYFNLLNCEFQLGFKLRHDFSYGFGIFGNFPRTYHPFPATTNPSQPANWTAHDAGVNGGDIRGIAITGPMNLPSGFSTSMDYAFVYARSAHRNNIEVIDLLKENVDDVKDWWRSNFFDCSLNVTVVENEDHPSILLYPNPTDNLVQIELKDHSSNLHYDVMNSIGQIMASGTPNHFAFQIDVSEWSPGLYFIRILNNGRIHTSRFIVY
jgi:hypothetical protein